MWVALTGTPGTGKSSVARLLQKQGYTIVRLHQLAREFKCIDGTDTIRGSQLVDVDELNSFIKKNISRDTLVFFEGHLGHLLNTINKVVILRCHPQVLKKRLMKKKWSTKKIKENVDAETIDIILCEAVEHHSKENIFEIDTTKRTIEEVATIIKNLVNKKFQPIKKYTIGQIDWSEEIFKEYPT